ncbi:MAG: hypothetical protein VZR53_03875 [Prevotella sp.]|nr:hypothetical protein [Prevotella sp.]
MNTKTKKFNDNVNANDNKLIEHGDTKKFNDNVNDDDNETFIAHEYTQISTNLRR